jgi:hypothetical protein
MMEVPIMTKRGFVSPGWYIVPVVQMFLHVLSQGGADNVLDILKGCACWFSIDAR